MSDPVHHPDHYTSHPSGIECIEVTRWMSFDLGNAVKYVWRADLKNGVEDLEKALWYLNDAIRGDAGGYFRGSDFSRFAPGLRAAAAAERSVYGDSWLRADFFDAMSRGRLRSARDIVIRLVESLGVPAAFTTEAAEAFLRAYVSTEGDGLDLQTLQQVYRRARAQAHPDRDRADRTQLDRVEAAAEVLRAAGRLP